ncbi:hypothetical protein C7212DRAFT_329151, partial [Tuber magnatum]
MLSKAIIPFILLVFLTIFSINLIAPSSAVPVLGSTPTGSNSNKLESLKEIAANNINNPSARTWRRCETSSVSPTLSEIYGVVQALQQRAGNCCNAAIRRNECTNIIAVGGADIGFCGIQRCISCSQMGAEVWWMAQECQRDGKAVLTLICIRFRLSLIF